MNMLTVTSHLSYNMLLPESSLFMQLNALVVTSKVHINTLKNSS